MHVQSMPNAEDNSLQHHVHSGGLVIAQSLAFVAGLKKLSGKCSSEVFSLMYRSSASPWLL